MMVLATNLTELNWTDKPCIYCTVIKRAKVTEKISLLKHFYLPMAICRSVLFVSRFILHPNTVCGILIVVHYILKKSVHGYFSVDSPNHFWLRFSFCLSPNSVNSKLYTATKSGTIYTVCHMPSSKSFLWEMSPLQNTYVQRCALIYSSRTTKT